MSTCSICFHGEVKKNNYLDLPLILSCAIYMLFWVFVVCISESTFIGPHPFCTPIYSLFCSYIAKY